MTKPKTDSLLLCCVAASKMLSQAKITKSFRERKPVLICFLFQQHPQFSKSQSCIYVDFELDVWICKMPWIVYAYHSSL